MDDVASEVDNGSSVTLGILPCICDDEPLSDDSLGHEYVVIGYNSELKAIKLYDPNCNPKFCVSSENLPRSLTSGADPNKGEMWISWDEIQHRELSVTSLCSSNIYKSLFRFKQKLKPSEFDEKNFACLPLCKAVVSKTSTFMMNLFSYSHEFDWFDIKVQTADGQNVELDYQLPANLETAYGPHSCNGDVATQFNQKFQVQPNTYFFSLEIQPICESVLDKEVNLLFKIGSVEECLIEK